MKVNFIKYKPFIECKNPFLYIVKDRNSLPQVQKLNNFIDENRITDLAYYPTNTQHDLICVILNENYCNLEKLNEIILDAATKSKKYLYLAINKFLIYSTKNIQFITSNYDAKLVEYCKTALANQFTIIDYSIRSDDDGSLGNFIHPVTTVFYKRNEEVSN